MTMHLSPATPPSRRRFAAGAGLALPAVYAWGQATAVRKVRIGWVSATSREEPYAQALLQRLAELGWVDGRNMVVEFRVSSPRDADYQRHAAELQALHCELYVAPGNPIALRAMLAATRDTPVVTVANDFDPVAAGFVASLARPGGRVTGVSQLLSELPGKRLDLVRELLPKARRVATIADAVTREQLVAARQTAAALGLELVLHEFGAAPYDFASAFSRFSAAHADIFVPLSSGFFAAERKAILALVQAHRLPAIFPNAVWVQAGGLMSYGPDFLASYRRAADIVAALLRGARAADTPMEQAQQVELAVNRRALAALGLTLPPALALRVDRTIDG